MNDDQCELMLNQMNQLTELLCLVVDAINRVAQSVNCLPARFSISEKASLVGQGCTPLK